MPRLGTKKLYHLLKNIFLDKGIKLGRDGLFSLLRNEQMLISPRKNYTKTTDSKHWLKKHPNLLKNAQIERPEQFFVSDITYLKTRDRTHYLALVTDACSRKIMGYNLSNDLGAESVARALDMAISKRITTRKVIHHSDRGLQYAAYIYQNKLKKAGIVPSMTDGYDCYQNAMAERINGILKQEFLYVKCNTYDELKELVRESIEIYNSERPHLSLNMKTPNYVHKKGCEVNLTAQS